MGLDYVIVLWDDYGNWYLTLKFNPKANKFLLINEVTKSLRQNFFPKDNILFLVDNPRWIKPQLASQDEQIID